MKGLFVTKITLFAVLLIGCDSILDIKPPEVQITNPKEGAYIDDQVNIDIQADDNKAIKKVEIYADDTLLTTIENEPFSYQWQRFMDCSTHTVKAKAFDGAGNWRESDSIFVQSLPVLLSTSDVGSARNICIQGNYLYMANEILGGFRIIDISNPYTPIEVALCDTEFNVMDIFVAGNFAYVVGWRGYDSLRILNISNPVNPNSVGACRLYSGNDIIVDNQYAYISSEASDYPLQIVDVSDPSAPLLISWLSEPDAYFLDLCYQNNFLYIVESNSSYSDNALRVVDVTNPSIPITVGSISLPATSYNILAQGIYAYTENEIVNVANPTSPCITNSFDSILSNASDIWIKDDYAYLSWDCGLRIINISNKDDIILSGELWDGNYWSYAAVIGDLLNVYVEEYGHLHIIRVSP